MWIRGSSGEGNGTPLQYSCMGNPMDGGAWWAAVHGVVKSQTRMSDFTFTFHFHALEKEMATHSSVLAWRIPGTGEPGGLPSLGSHGVGHDWSDLAAAAVARDSSNGVFDGYAFLQADCAYSLYKEMGYMWNRPFSVYLNHFALKNTAYQQIFIFLVLSAISLKASIPLIL